uniref:Transmembrane protein n=1 Tax=Pithovirus LCPAC001 TaxID=2506585 RepID=A0A481Z3X4_9VIRU|nr:MAG: hypothetical protein LCPAC001_01920 [Pithovirus LCPAC001]
MNTDTIIIFGEGKNKIKLYAKGKLDINTTTITEKHSYNSIAKRICIDLSLVLCGMCLGIFLMEPCPKKNN